MCNILKSRAGGNLSWIYYINNGYIYFVDCDNSFWMHAYLQTHQIVYTKYVQGFFVYKLYLNKSV